MKLHIGIHHTRNSRRDDFYIHKCKAYMNWYDKNRLRHIQQREHRNPDEYDKRDVKSHLMHCYTNLYMQSHIGRVKKYAIRKMFNYWYKVPGAYLNPDEFVNYDIMTSYPMYSGNRDEVRYPIGTPGCCILYITFFKRNKKALTKKQQNLLDELHSHREK